MGRTMTRAPSPTLDGREAIGPWHYSARIPEGASSRDYAFIPLVTAAICASMGTFLACDVGGDVPLWSNAAVWVAVLMSALGSTLSVWMFVGRWAWTAPQMAMFGIAGLAPIYWAFQGASLFAFFLYSHAPFMARASVLLCFLGWHGWWIFQTAKRCMSIWSDVAWREKVWVPYECATVYRQFAAKAAMDAKGVTWHPGPFGILLPMLLCIPMYACRHELVSHLGIPWVPMIGLMLGFSVLVLMSAAITASVVSMLIIPARIVASTGKPVLVDMMTPADAPR